MSPTVLSLKHYRDMGYVAWVVEKFNSFAKVRQDFLGCIDILCFKGSVPGVIGIQTTTDANFNKRIYKAMQNEYLEEWMKAGNKFIVHGWGKHGPRGKRKLWELKTHELTLFNLGSKQTI